MAKANRNHKGEEHELLIRYIMNAKYWYTIYITYWCRALVNIKLH